MAINIAVLRDISQFGRFDSLCQIPCYVQLGYVLCVICSNYYNHFCRHILVVSNTFTHAAAV